MKVTKGSKVELEINFNIPINNVFNKIEIENSLPLGLAYDNSIKVYVDGIRIYADIVNASTPEKVSITLNDNISKGDTIKRIDIIIDTFVTDIDILLSKIDEGVLSSLENIITIIARDVNNKKLSEEEFRTELDIERYNIYGFALGYNVKKIGGETAYLIANVSTMDAAGDNSIDYKFTIQANDYLDVSGADYTNSFITMNGRTIGITGYGGSITVTGQSIEVRIKHTSSTRANKFYISIPAIIRDTVINIEEDFILSESKLELEYFDLGIMEYQTIATSPTFNIRTNLEYAKPELNSAIKIII